MPDFTVHFTKLEKIFEVNNSMCHNYYYMQHGRIYNADKTKFRRFKFVFWFDIFDAMEYLDQDTLTKQNIRMYANDIAFNYYESYGGLIKSFDDCQAFYDWCNETIDDFNK